MASSTWKVPANVIATFTDAEIRDHLSHNYGFVMVDDPGNLPEEFIQRLTYEPCHSANLTTSNGYY